MRQSRARGDAVAFAPPGPAWQRVDPRLATARRIVATAVLGLAAAAGVAGALLAGQPVLLVLPAAALGVLGWLWWLIGRQVGAYGYAERADDLLVTRGIMFRRLSMVPYGRMQFVDVTAGPVERRYGLATVQLHTAAPATDARIPGLPEPEAAQLRDRLAALGEARAAGL